MKSSSTFRRTLILLGSLAVWLSVGCGGGGGGADITNVEVILPDDFSSDGGPVTVQADVTDAVGLQEVRIVITRPDGSTEDSILMSATGETTYVGNYDSPANLRTDGQPEVYTIAVVAVYSGAGDVISESLQFQVPAPDIPEPPQ